MKKSVPSSPRVNPPKTHLKGIPEVLTSIHLEKASEVIPVKIQFSLKNYLQQHKRPVSAFVRTAIIEKLEQEAIKVGGSS